MEPRRDPEVAYSAHSVGRYRYSVGSGIYSVLNVAYTALNGMFYMQMYLMGFTG